MADYAIVQTGGKQYRVQPGGTIRVETLPGDEGAKVDLTDVVMLSHNGDVTLGNPTVAGAKVVAEVLGRGRGKKIIVFKYKAKTRYRRKAGHRQSYTDLKIVDIQLNGRSTLPAQRAAKAPTGRTKQDDAATTPAKRVAKGTAKAPTGRTKQDTATTPAKRAAKGTAKAATGRAKQDAATTPAKRATKGTAKATPGRAKQGAATTPAKRAAKGAAKATPGRTSKRTSTRTTKSTAKTSTRRSSTSTRS